MMIDNLDKMARIGREIEKRMVAAYEKDGWVVSVAMMSPESLRGIISMETLT